MRPTETSYRKEAHHFDRFMHEQAPIAGGPKTRNPTGADGSPNGNGPSEGKIESKKSSRLVSNNVNSIAYTSAMVNGNGKTRGGAASHVIAPNQNRAFNAVFEKRMSIGRRSQESQIAIMNSSNRGNHITRLSQDSLT